MRVRSATAWWAHPAPWGLALRLLLMPLGACWDLFGNYWVSHQWVYHGAVPADQYGGGMWVWLPLWFHAAWLWLIRPLLGAGDPWGEGLVPSLLLAGPWTTPEAIHAFYLQPHIHAVLFLLKLPYVLAELILIWMLLRHTAGPAATRQRMAWFLWLNPVSLFLVSWCGTWDVLPTALVTGSVLLLHRRRLWAGLCFGLGLIAKTFPLMLFPFFVLLGARERTQRVRVAGVLLLPVLVFLVAGEWAGASLVSMVLETPHYGMALTSQVVLWWHDSLYLSIIGYTLFVFHAARFGNASMAGLVRYCGAVLLLFYSSSFFHPQYFFWCVPFLAVLLSQRRGLLWLFAVQSLALGVYMLQWGPIFTTYVLAPLNPDFFIPHLSPYEWLARYTDPEQVVGIAHSVLAGVSLWMIYEVMGRHPKAAA